MSKRIVLTGGGTAGHVTPHLSLIPRLREMGYEIHYIGTNGIEKQIIMLRFGLGGQQERTQKEVADLLGISQSYISRLEKRILSRLHTELKRIG